MEQVTNFFTGLAEILILGAPIWIALLLLALAVWIIWHLWRRN